MNYKNFRSIKTLTFVPLITFCMITAVYAETDVAKDPSTSMSKAGMEKGSGGSVEMMKSMESGMDGMGNMKMSGDTDKDFAMMMKMHHQKALDMAQMELDNGKSPEMKKMAKQIIVAQKKEIVQFDRWIDKHK